MWAQIVKSRLKPGKEGEMRQIQEEMRSSQSNSAAMIRNITLQNQNDPDEYYSVIMFESEEKAREREQSPEQQAFVGRIQACMEGRPEFVDCNVVSDVSP